MLDGAEFKALRPVLEEWFNKRGVVPSEWQGATQPKQYVAWLDDSSETPYGEYVTYHEMIAALFEYVDNMETVA